MKKKKVVDPTTPFKYESGEVPATYMCHKCGKTHRKLWREYNTFLDWQELVCAPCLTKKYKTPDFKPMFNPTENGEGHWSNNKGFPESDQIGHYVPAVPTEENHSYWGYTSVPLAGCQWWYNLPFGYDDVVDQILLSLQACLEEERCDYENPDAKIKETGADSLDLCMIVLHFEKMYDIKIGDKKVAEIHEANPTLREFAQLIKDDYLS